MAWEHREGQGTLFQNDYKEKDTQPDFKGDGLVNGQLMEVAAWWKEGRKGRFLSLSIKPKAERAEAAQSKFSRHEDEPEQPGSLREAVDDEIPF